MEKRNSIVITNQHCDNRGDESATIGLIEQIYHYFGNDTRIIMLKQTPDYPFISREYHVEEKNMIYSIGFLFQMLIWIGLEFVGVDIRSFLSQRFQDYLNMYEQADMVLSSCGGPYIGDLYINHEIVHILYVLIPELLGKKVIFSAPSMGPFKIKIMNPIRKYILKNASGIFLRDKISYDHVLNFIGRDEKIKLVADACFANEIKEKKKLCEKKNVIGFTPLAYSYPKSKDAEKERAKYKENIIRLFDNLMDRDQELKVQFFPQLYNKHSDMELIQDFQRSMKYKERTIIFSDKLSGVEQQKEIGNMKMMIATRYHSAVFACKMFVPCICIAYEHKAFAMMDSFGLSDCVIDINELSYQRLEEKYDYVCNRYNAIYNVLTEKLPTITEKAKETIRLAKEVYDAEA